MPLSEFMPMGRNDDYDPEPEDLLEVDVVSFPTEHRKWNGCCFVFLAS